jgi:hypothetical protein
MYLIRSSIGRVSERGGGGGGMKQMDERLRAWNRTRREKVEANLISFTLRVRRHVKYLEHIIRFL